MLLSSLIMPFFALLYYKYIGKTPVDPMQFYRWSALGYTLWIILPFVLGVFCTLIMYEENHSDTLTQLWLVPLSKIGYLSSKFLVTLMYSICFMLITAIASVLCSTLTGYVAFDWENVIYIFQKCLEIGILCSFAMLPILAIAAVQKGYILSICITLVYTFFGFFIVYVNMHIHPLASMAMIVMRNRDIPGVVLPQAMNIPLAFVCIGIWDIAAVLFAVIALTKRK